MRLQTAKLRAQLRDVEFDFIQGTVPMENIDAALERRFEGPFMSWYDVTHDAYEGRRDPAEYVKALMDESVTFTYPHAEEAMARVESHVESHGPYDALLGFSMGAILITLLTASRLARARAGQGPPPSWRHNVLVCGMPVRAQQYYSLLESPLDFPCTVAQGAQDPLYAWCHRLAASYAEAEYLEYDDGHRFPHRLEDTRRLAASVRRGLTELTAASGA